MAKKRDRGTIIRVKVIPRSSGNRILGNEAGVWKLKVTSPPVGGKANLAVREFLAGCLGVAKGRLEIVSGGRSSRKSILVEGLELDAVRDILEKKAQKTKGRESA